MLQSQWRRFESAIKKKMRGRLMRFVAGNLIYKKIRYIYFNGSRRNSQQLRYQEFTVLTELAVATVLIISLSVKKKIPVTYRQLGEAWWDNFFSHFSACQCFSKFFLKWRKNYCSSVTKERYKFIKPDRILSAENIKIASLKILKTIGICGTGEGIYNKTANKLSKSLGIVIGNGPLKISNFQ